MNTQQNSRARVAGLILAGVLGASGGVVAAGLVPARPVMSEHGMRVWGQRLTEQAEILRRDRADAAYGARLRAVAEERGAHAWTARLDGLAAERGVSGMSDRAANAWTARLNGLAEAADTP